MRVRQGFAVVLPLVVLQLLGCASAQSTSMVPAANAPMAERRAYFQSHRSLSTLATRSGAGLVRNNGSRVVDVAAEFEPVASRSPTLRTLQAESDALQFWVYASYATGAAAATVGLSASSAMLLTQSNDNLPEWALYAAAGAKLVSVGLTLGAAALMVHTVGKAALQRKRFADEHDTILREALDLREDDVADLPQPSPIHIKTPLQATPLLATPLEE